jgi:hypothetical protein
MNRVLVTIALALLAWACQPAPLSSGGVNPAPPGPVDMVRSMWGDYSGRCPGGYQYCNGASHSICCPVGDRCEEDSGGSYCVRRTGEREAPAYGEAAADHLPPACQPEEITCSYAGRTACCPSNQRCCALSDGPACCDAPSVQPEFH